MPPAVAQPGGQQPTDLEHLIPVADKIVYFGPIGWRQAIDGQSQEKNVSALPVDRRNPADSVHWWIGTGSGPAGTPESAPELQR